MKLERPAPQRVLLAMLLFVFIAPAPTGWAQVLPQAGPAQAEQSPSQASEREFPFPVAAVQSALQQIGAYRGARLPSLEGFVEL